MFMPSGRNKGNITEDIKSTVISGTPLQNSMNRMHRVLITGRVDLLPRASRIPRGNDPTIPTAAIIRVRDSPPQLEVSTEVNPKKPPLKRINERIGNPSKRKNVIDFCKLFLTNFKKTRDKKKPIKTKFNRQISFSG